MAGQEKTDVGIMGHHTYPDPAPMWSAIPGWFDFQQVYQELAGRAQDGDVFVEIGCYLGRSGCFFGDALRTTGKRVTLLCVDVWPAQFDFQDGSGTVIEAPFETFLANVRQCRLTKIIVPLRCESLRAAQFVTNNLAAVFIDGEHDYDNCKADIAAWMPKVRQGGILAGHDFSATFPGVEKAVREAFGDNIRVIGQSWLHDKPA